MWPFKKSTHTACMSGVATCDGKHHHWSAWKNIKIDRTFYRPWASGPMTATADGQERICIICNYVERRIIGEEN